MYGLAVTASVAWWLDVCHRRGVRLKFSMALIVYVTSDLLKVSDRELRQLCTSCASLKSIALVFTDK